MTITKPTNNQLSALALAFSTDRQVESVLGRSMTDAEKTVVDRERAMQTIRKHRAQNAKTRSV